MSYRLLDEPMAHIFDTSMQSVITVDNGTISRISIPCFYGSPITPGKLLCRHERNIQDHNGWPSPRNHDDSWQGPCKPMDVPDNIIDLVKEGYDSVQIAFSSPPDGLNARGSIDFNYIDIVFDIMCPAVAEEDVDVPFCVYVIGNTPDYPGEPSEQLRDVVTKGVLHIVAGPVSIMEQDNDNN